MRTFIFSILLLAPLALTAQKGHQIDVTIDGYEQEILLLAYYYGDKQYILDTAYRETNGHYIFEGPDSHEPGIYFLVMRPDNAYFDFLITEDEQRFSLSAQKDNMLGTVEVKGRAKENRRFFEYMNFLGESRSTLEKIKSDKSKTEEEIKKEQEQINKQVVSYQDDLIRKNPNSFTAAIIKANKPIEYPEFSGSQEDIQRKRWRHTQKHFFDNLDLSQHRLLRTPFLQRKIEQFVDKLQVQHPDTIAVAIDYVLNKLEPVEESFKYYVIHFLNKYARSKIVGMDAVYVHMVDNYYRTGKAPWTDQDQLRKMLDNADRLRPLLIGKIAPDLAMQTRDNKELSLHEIESEYTVLYFWKYDCGHCKDSTPILKEFYNKFKDQGVELVAVCTKYYNEFEGCWDYVDEQEIGDWVHLADPYSRSRFTQIYDIKSTPQIYILDANKKILSKRIGAKQLEEVITNLMKK